MDEQALWSVESVLAARPASACVARRLVGEHLGEHGLGHLVEDVRLVVSELVTNALVHAATPVTLSVQGFEQSLVVTVRDGSPVRPVMVDASGLEPGGRGLMIVDLLSLDWGVIGGPAGGKSVWASFATAQSPAVAHRLNAYAPSGNAHAGG